VGILYDIMSLTRRRHCSGLGRVCTLPSTSWSLVN